MNDLLADPVPIAFENPVPAMPRVKSRQAGCARAFLRSTGFGGDCIEHRERELRTGLIVDRASR